MKVVCSLDPEQYPNSSRLCELIEELCGDKPGEIAIDHDSHASDRICLRFWNMASSRRMLLSSWSVNQCLFSLPASIGALERITQRFLESLPKESRSQCNGRSVAMSKGPSRLG